MDDDEVVRHHVGILEDDLEGFSHLHDEARRVVTHLFDDGANHKARHAQTGQGGAERCGFGGGHGIHEQAGDLNGLDVIAAGAFARVGFAGPSHEIARGGGGGLGGPIGARERAQTLGGGRHLITAGDHAGDGVKDGSGFSARADGGADGVTLHGLHDAIGTGEIGDGGGENRHHEVVGGGA